jgi:organic radical activating enzyme
VIVTGGEPALQWDTALAATLRLAGFRVHMETNGTRALAAPVDWLTVSPKPRFHEGRETLVLTAGDECKVVVDDSVDEVVLEGYERMAFREWFVQPCMDAGYDAHLRRAVALASARPRWRLGLQLHKAIGVP